MTEQEAIDKLKELSKWRDIENAHMEADNVLCKLLTLLGYQKVVDEFEKVGKWYA
jgi:hypothetical protein